MGVKDSSEEQSGGITRINVDLMEIVSLINTIELFVDHAGTFNALNYHDFIINSGLLGT